jgi:hypothetical protein
MESIDGTAWIAHELVSIEWAQQPRIKLDVVLPLEADA